MWNQYVGSLVHFSLSIGVAGVMAAIAWLYMDAYRVSYSKRELIRVAGLIILALSFVFSGVQPQGSAWNMTGFGTSWVPSLLLTFRVLGYGLIIVGMILEPLQPLPYALAGLGFIGVEQHVEWGLLLLPILATGVGLLYWRRATIGIEAHMRRPAFGFWLLAIYELLQLSRNWYGTYDPRLWEVVRPFGELWWLGRIVLFAAVLLLGRWVFSYLLKQFTVQLFIIFSGVFLLSFMGVTAGYTGLLLKEIRNEATKQVMTSLNVLRYAFEEQQDRLLSEAQLAADNAEIKTVFVENENGQQLASVLRELIVGKKINEAAVIDNKGLVVWSSERPDQVGAVFGNEALMMRLLRGESVKTIMPVGEELVLYSVTPVSEGDEVVGGVVMGLTIDPLLLSGIKTATGLEVGVFKDQLLSASSLSVDQGDLVGIVEDREEIVDLVFNGQIYRGPVEFLGVPYLAVYEPVVDENGVVVGMLFGGRSEVEVMATAARSLEITFYITASLIVLSWWPAWKIAKSIQQQV